MKAAVVLFHKNVDRYPQEWIHQCINSIRLQTYQNFDVFELEYGFVSENNPNNTQIYEGSIFESTKGTNNLISTHADALNYLLDKVFKKGYDCAFNVNIDDYYDYTRFEKQIKYIEAGYDIVSSNFHVVNRDGIITKSLEMHTKDIDREFNNNNNIIAHPVICYSKNFKERLIPSEIPRDDFECWKRAYASGKYRFAILPEYLLFYRDHSQKTS